MCFAHSRAVGMSRSDCFLVPTCASKPFFLCNKKNAFACTFVSISACECIVNRFFIKFAIVFILELPLYSKGLRLYLQFYFLEFILRLQQLLIFRFLLLILQRRILLHRFLLRMQLLMQVLFHEQFFHRCLK